jgi:hypothetical protein
MLESENNHYKNISKTDGNRTTSRNTECMLNLVIRENTQAPQDVN